MKKTKRLWALLLVMVMALGLITTAFAAPTIDSGRKASLSLYKYDITAASADGVWDAASYVSTGVQDDAVTDKLAQYAIQGVEFSYLRVASISTYSQRENGQYKVGVLYGFADDAVLQAIGLTKADAYKRGNGVFYFTSDKLNKALADALADNATSEKMVKFLREKYPPGTRIRLVSMEDPYAPVAPGTEGTLVCVDDAGQFQMKWDNGRTLALIPGEDSFTVLPPERSVLKLYMPLTAELYEPDEWGDMPEEAERLTGGELASYEDKIRSALFKNRMQEEQIRGIMYWYRKPDSVNDKVHSVVFDVEQRHGRLWGVAECQISGELSDGELAALKKYISGQASDGWGEGFEQREIELDGGRELYVHLWQDEDWSIRTEQERFEPYRDKLPQLCFTLLPGTGQLICVKRGESGYYPSDWSTPDAQENRRIADEQNQKLGVTPAQETAMKIGSMCGWDVPGADPDNCMDIAQQRGGMELG